uniref:Uncharacterized protein n=1 Tax=Anguilla anguilla TaxID=7936 RepID=A0A0E9QU39_ANGAN
MKRALIPPICTALLQTIKFPANRCEFVDCP